jgi:hypothetical protein
MNTAKTHLGIQLDIHKGSTKVHFVEHKPEATELDHGKFGFVVCF